MKKLILAASLTILTAGCTSMEPVPEQGSLRAPASTATATLQVLSSDKARVFDRNGATVRDLKCRSGLVSSSNFEVRCPPVLNNGESFGIRIQLDRSQNQWGNSADTPGFLNLKGADAVTLNCSAAGQVSNPGPEFPILCN